MYVPYVTLLVNAVTVFACDWSVIRNGTDKVSPFHSDQA